jgi:hypothetical protein
VSLLHVVSERLAQISQRICICSFVCFSDTSLTDCCEHSNEPLGFIKGGNSLTACVTISRTEFHRASRPCI